MARPAQGKTISESLRQSSETDTNSSEENDAYRGPDGHFQPMEQIMPMDESSIGGFRRELSSVSIPPPPPPKDVYSTITPSDGSSVWSSRLSGMTAVERSKALRTARMDPHLQFMVGPLLRYDTIDQQGYWNGSVLIVSTSSIPRF
jgi:hypothetical protein